VAKKEALNLERHKMEKRCPKCGEMVESEDLDKPADFYYCDCGWEFCDTAGWADNLERRINDCTK